MPVLTFAKSKDREQWKAKLITTKTGIRRVEIRRTIGRGNLLIIIAGAKRLYVARTWLNPYEMQISANDRMRFKVGVFAEMKDAVQEARDVLATLDNKDTPKPLKDNTLAAIKAGTWPLAAP